MKLSDTQVEVVSVDKLIKNFKKQTNKNFHFPTDGHWNKMHIKCWALGCLKLFIDNLSPNPVFVNS